MTGTHTHLHNIGVLKNIKSCEDVVISDINVFQATILQFLFLLPTSITQVLMFFMSFLTRSLPVNSLRFTSTSESCTTHPLKGTQCKIQASSGQILDGRAHSLSLPLRSLPVHYNGLRP